MVCRLNSLQSCFSFGLNGEDKVWIWVFRRWIFMCVGHLRVSPVFRKGIWIEYKVFTGENVPWAGFEKNKRLPPLNLPETSGISNYVANHSLERIFLRFWVQRINKRHRNILENLFKEDFTVKNRAKIRKPPYSQTEPPCCT